MYPARFEYHRPTSIDHGLRLLGSLEGDVRLLAGGHSLVPALKLRLAAPSHLIDISGCAELKGVREEEGRVVIGAATTYRELEQHALLAAKAPLVPAIARQVADMLVRNRGTIGGSLCNSDPNADFPVGILALDARMHARSLGGSRVIAVSDWFDGLMSTALRPDEILEAVSVQVQPGQTRCAYVKVKHAASRFGVACAAVNLLVSGDGLVRSASIAIGGLTDNPVRLNGLEALLVGRTLAQPEQGDEVGEQLAAGTAGLPPSKQWLLHVAAGAIRKALGECSRDA